MHRIGMMQGRLLPMVDGRIQAFPGARWEEEFALISDLGYDALELTVEMKSWDSHPTRSEAGRARIRALSAAHGVHVSGICGDVFMERPLVADDTAVRRQGLDMLLAMLDDAADLGLPMVEVPMMGDNSLLLDGARKHFDAAMAEALPRAEAAGVDIILESDLPPRHLATLMDGFDHRRLGINYDMGNSTWFGYDPDGELPLYGRHVRNIHVKDCNVHDYSVPLGSGATRFDRVFAQLKALAYRGDFILQAARQADDLAAGRDYLPFIRHWVDSLAPAEA